MNGPEHYANAQHMIATAVTHFAAGDHAEGEFVIKVAQVHATLALTAATAEAGAVPNPGSGVSGHRWKDALS